MNRKKFFLFFCTLFLTVVIFSTGVYPSPRITSLEEAVKFVSYMERMKAHLWGSLEQLKAGNREVAKSHARHPAEELWPLLGPQIAEANPTLHQQIKTRISALPQQVEKKTVNQYEYKLKEIKTLIDKAINQVVNQKYHSSFGFQVRVAISLLEWSQHEYQEALTSEKLLKEEIQDASGGIHQAELIYEEISEQIEKKEAQEIREFFDSLNLAVDERKTINKVKAWTRGIISELREVAGLEEKEAEKAHSQLVQEIVTLLNSVIHEYREGEYEQATELAIIAYLEKYEVIEPQVIQLAPNLNEKIEIPMRVELRKMINNRVPVAEISSFVDQLIELLFKVDQVLAEAS